MQTTILIMDALEAVALLLIVVVICIYVRKILQGFATPPAILHAVIKSRGLEITKLMLTDIQTGKIVAVILDADGNPASLPAGVTWSWSSNNPLIASVASDPSDPSGLTGIVTPNSTAGNLGLCNINGASSDGLITTVTPCQVVSSAATQATATLTAQ